MENINHISANHASKLSTEEITGKLHSDIIEGLSEREALMRLIKFGKNELRTLKENTLWRKFLYQFTEPMILLLFISALISLFLGNIHDAISITFAVLIVCSVAFIQGYRSEKAINSLKLLISRKCRCLREGILQEINACDLVPGDIVQLLSGDRIPADMRLITTNNLEVDESNISGESETVYKCHNAILSSQLKQINTLQNSELENTLRFDDQQENMKLSTSYPKVPENANIAFMGTLVRGGNGRGIVISTGLSSSFGEIYNLMQSEEAPRTPLQNGMDKLGKHLSMLSLGIIILILVLGLTQNRPLLELFNIGVSLAVAAIPEGLPIVVTVTLAIGQIRMSRRNAIVKNLSAVETLGCVNIICTDKTGTLTNNQMTVTRIVTSGLERFTIPEGIIHDYSPLISNGTIRRIVEVGCLCNNSYLHDNKKTYSGQSTEGALLMFASKIGLTDPRNNQRRLGERPFNSESKLMVVNCVPRQCQIASDCDCNDLKFEFFAKGCLESLLKNCVSYRRPVSSHRISNVFPEAYDGEIAELSEKIAEEFYEEARMLGKDGLRVLAFAEGYAADELIFLGLVGLMDTPRYGVEDAIKKIISAGVKVIMLTGDSKETAFSIASRLGILAIEKRAMAGVEIDRINTDDFIQCVNDITVFYRTTPRHKCKIVRALQSKGSVVAMTGDGVNDAVAVKIADVGIAMGEGGTDVCKEAADIILIDNNFISIVAAIEEGKAIFNNIRNFICFQLSTSISALSLIALSSIFKLPCPLNPMQILYINILMDGPPAQSLGLEPACKDTLREPQRYVRENVLTSRLLSYILLSTVVIVTGTFYVFHNGLSYTGEITSRDTTMSFTCFVFFDIFNALSCRSQDKSIFAIGFLSNKVFLVTASLSIFGQMLVVYATPLQKIFLTEALTFPDLFKLVCISATVFIISEIRKLIESALMNKLFCKYFVHKFKIESLVHSIFDRSRSPDTFPV